MPLALPLVKIDRWIENSLSYTTEHNKLHTKFSIIMIYSLIRPKKKHFPTGEN